jgi:hypothetical protein
MEDIRIGRISTARVVSTAVATTATQVLARDNRRTSVTFGAAPSGTHTISPEKSVAATTGLNIGTATPPVQFTVQEHGQLVTGEWWAVHSVGAVNLTAVETYLPQDPE